MLYLDNYVQIVAPKILTAEHTFVSNGCEICNRLTGFLLGTQLKLIKNLFTIDCDFIAIIQFASFVTFPMSNSGLFLADDDSVWKERVFTPFE